MIQTKTAARSTSLLLNDDNHTLVSLVEDGRFDIQAYINDLAVKEMLNIAPKVLQNCEADINMSTLTAKIWWPGCGWNKPDKCGLPCYSGSLIEDMQAFNKHAGGVKVTYSSRTQAGVETVQLGGWWLPPTTSPASAPRIVVQHGFQVNSNDFTVQLVAYLLRKAGFGVLINNFRDHCYSANSSARTVEWGHAYPFDLLGAWDFAVNDPTGVLGGTRNSSQVGLLGFSMGAFVTASAFGLEPRVPAVWVDSPPFQPKIVFGFGAKKLLQGFGIGDLQADALINKSWEQVLEAANKRGVDINEYLPEKTLPQGPDTQRPIYWVGNRLDTIVPYTDGGKLIDLLKSLPAKYSVKSWLNNGTCVGTDHCADHVRAPEKYLAHLCGFWQSVFNEAMEGCQRGQAKARW